MKRKTKEEKMNICCFLFHLRTTVNRSTFVGRDGRTNDERVCGVVFDVWDEVVTKHPLKSLEPSSYIDESSTNPVVVVVVV